MFSFKYKGLIITKTTRGLGPRFVSILLPNGVLITGHSVCINFLRHYSTGRCQKPSQEILNSYSCATCFPYLNPSPRAISSSLKGKAGVYMIYNTINGKFYIGSSINLSARIARHFYEAQHGDSQLPLYRAFRKYGLDKFSIIILTFCEPDSSICTALEQSALDTHKPEYNILKQAGVSTGFKHTEETIKHLQDLHSGENHPRYGVTPTETQREATSIALKRTSPGGIIMLSMFITIRVKRGP